MHSAKELPVKRFSAWAEKTLPLIKNIFIPAAVLTAAVLVFYGIPDLNRGTQLTLHTLFYLLTLLTFGIMLFFNQSKPVFFLLIIILDYALINHLKIAAPAAFADTALFADLGFFTPFYLLLFAFLPERHLLTRFNAGILLLVFAQFAVIEHLNQNGLSLAYPLYETASPLDSSNQLLFLFLFLTLFIRSVAAGKIFDYALLFAALETGIGFYYADSAAAMTVFFTAAVLTVLLAVVTDIFYSTRHDALTGLGSRKAFIIDAGRFPIKYSLGIICIDDYQPLAKMLGRRGRNVLTRLVASIIREKEPDERIYRYSEDEFILILNITEDKNSSFNRLETIRRAVASSAFILPSKKRPIKITVSGSVSDKKRSDADVYEVLARTRKALQKTLSFSHNVTSKA